MSWILFASMLLLANACHFERSKSLLYDVSFLADLPVELNECSGLAYHDGFIYAINDGNNAANIYVLDVIDFTLTNTIELSSISNRDWEALSFRDNRVYIGDIGNNAGKRMDLKLYSFNLNNPSSVESLPLNYADQISFSDTFHNYDCESIVLMGNMLFMFTKHTKDINETKMYQTRLTNGELSIVDKFAVPAVPTDAYYHKRSNEVFLLCNDDSLTPKESYVLVLAFDENFSVEIKHQLIISVDDDLEAICYIDDFGFVLASEKEDASGGKLYHLDIKGY